MAGFYSGNVTASDNSTIGGISSTGADLPSNFDNIVREIVAQAMRFALDQGGAVTVAGTSDAITVTTNSQDSGAYINGFAVTFIAGADNGTTTPTINIDNRGSAPLKKAVLGAETALAAADIKNGGLYRVFYRSSWNSGNGAFQIVGLDPLALIADAAISLSKLADGTAGDILFWNGSGKPTALAKGTDGQVLGLNSGLPAWQAAAAAPNIVTNLVTAASSYAASADREITELTTSITTSADSAKVLVIASISFERNIDGAFYLTRNGTEVGSAAAAGSRTVGIIPVAYDANNASTISQATIAFLDTVPTAGATEYKFKVRGSNVEFYLNRSVTDGDSAGYIRASSTIILQEIA